MLAEEKEKMKQQEEKEQKAVKEANQKAADEAALVAQKQIEKEKAAE